MPCPLEEVEKPQLGGAMDINEVLDLLGSLTLPRLKAKDSQDTVQGT